MRILPAALLVVALTLASLSIALLLWSPAPPSARSAAETLPSDEAPDGAHDAQVVQEAPPVQPQRTDLSADNDGTHELEPGSESPADTDGLRPVVLNIVDEETGTPLRQVEILRPNPSSSSSGAAGSQSLVVLRGNSPLHVLPPSKTGEPSDEVIQYWVQAEDYSYESVHLDFAVGGEREVPLSPAGGLQIFVDAPGDELNLMLELRPVDSTVAQLLRQADHWEASARWLGQPAVAGIGHRRAAARRLRDASSIEDPRAAREAAAGSMMVPATRRALAPRWTWVHFDHLAAGDWVAILKETSRKRALVGHAFLTVEAGQTQRSRIALEELWLQEGVPVSGTIEVPAAWTASSEVQAPGELHLQLIDRPSVQPAADCARQVEEFTAQSSEVFTWQAGELAPGLYAARLPEYGYVQEFELAPDSPADWTLRVPPPCEVQLRVEDRSTEKPALLGALRYSVGAADMGPRRLSVKRNGAGLFEFRAPQGRVHVRFEDYLGSYWINESAFDLQSGLNTLTVLVDRRADVRLHLRDGTAEIPWDDDYTVRSQSLGGKGGHAGWVTHQDRDVRHVFVPAGRYLVEVLGVRGFRTAEPVELELEAGKILDVDIPMVREGGAR